MDRANGAGPSAVANRAERFDDEKRRIVESCFAKKDPDGSLQETYITHIRITEYSNFPTSPPPPQARNPEMEKPRVIVVAVRKSGRVRVHKTKENANGTFSIGKTWNMDDLSHIESFTGPNVSPNLREWGGETGLLVTLGKPYYWQAQTEKEKKFFIASLVKIYGKYTGGGTPELAGFDQKDLDQILGAGKRSRNAVDPGLSQPSAAPVLIAPPPASSAATVASGVAADALRYPRATAIRPVQNEINSPAGSFESAASKERPTPRWTTQNNKSQDSLAARSEDASSLPPRSRNGVAGPGTAGRFGEPPEPPFLQDQPPPPSRQQQDGKLPPERRRPPMDPSRPLDRDLVPPPLMSTGAKREPMAPPPRSTERLATQNVPAVLQPGGRPTRDMTARETPVLAKNPLQVQVPAFPTAVPFAGSRNNTPVVSSPINAKVEIDDVVDTMLSDQAMGGREEEVRPGLGPMVKSKKTKNDIAGTMWKAASVAGAFCPRPGGAGERLRQTQAKPDDSPDGITSVVPAPSRPTSRDTGPATEHVRMTEAVPEVKVTLPVTATPAFLRGPVAETIKAAEMAKAIVQDAVPRRTVTVGQDAKYLQTLGVESSILDDRSDEFCKWLDYFGWVPGETMRSRNVDDIKNNVERELNTAQAGGWLTRFREEDERVNAIKKGIDLAMAECEELDNLLTLYSVELSTLSDDISYIEAQGQGLQVQTANQKLLKKELESLLETCAITSSDLEALQSAPLESLQGLEDVEQALVTLFKAMSKIDPSLGEGEAGKMVDVSLDPDQSLGLNSDYGRMRIVQEKKEMYLHEGTRFMRRLVEFMTRQFEEAFVETKRALDGALSKKVDAAHHDGGRGMLWKYSPLMLYARDADLESWSGLLQAYQEKSHPVYKHEFQNVVAIWRKNARKLTGEEAELLFSHQAEKKEEGVATTARKLTVKRSQTLARALRSPLADGGSRPTPVEKREGDVTRSLPYEVFSGVLDDLLPLVEMEQNFIIDFFHATTLEQVDFPDAVAACPPRERHGGDLRRHRLMEPDRELARRVNRSMEIIFSFLEVEIQRLMEWVTGQDPLQGVGVLATLERRSAEMGQSNQDFLNTVLQKLQGALEGRFRKFVDEQIRAIEETKVKINKRKGVISFFRVFPMFMAAVENMLVGIDQSHVLRRTIDREYDRILKTMFDSLMVIAREHPAVGVATGAADPEDKEALNFHILLIENMNHFLEEIDTRGLDILEEWKDQASTEYHEHMDLYLNAVMRRPLGKLLDHLENVEAQLQSGKSAMAIARQPSNSKAIFSKILGSYDSKEVRKGIEALRKRVEKHFGDADDPTLSRSLVVKVLKECEKFYMGVEGRIGRVTTDVYGGDVPFEWPRADVKAGFR